MNATTFQTIKFYPIQYKILYEANFPSDATGRDKENFEKNVIWDDNKSKIADTSSFACEQYYLPKADTWEIKDLGQKKNNSCFINNKVT